MSNPLDDVLRAAVLRRLDLLDQVAEQGDPATLLPLARSEISRLADGWRLLLTVHQPGPDRKCTACPRGWRGRRWPCQVWRMAHEHLIGEGLPHRERRRPLRNSLFRALRKSRSGQVPPELACEQTMEIPPVPRA
ncbi:hypothetical protein JOF56_003316 [Kibdelosporangium banguiense]|uniref:Uncharacterized protein n=1 Tax=Kibdelosporangium banguiense TaxID=1365924 RepID=A0ABS4TGF7_9PSEU|nr:hypothetical protein [Kibdelosporangium banguiense]MBP2322931.1 hypothetical protein [Kibdelosporangium banguiense]